ncbi:MAG: biotin--[acetyl-CoA-carboxylase] ligase [bacterium]|nr:biotin--[acetyl-CoA-carboxylase] ligase [bacterium]
MAVRWRIEHFGEIGSTSDAVRERARAGEPEGLVITAETQTAGRGRGDNVWVSPPGGLWFSILLRPRLDASAADLLSRIVPVALHPILDRYVPTKIKPPNDFVTRGLKYGGVLVETELRGGKVVYAVLGVGLDVNFELEHLPEGLARTATTILSETGRRHPLDTLLGELLGSLAETYETLKRDPNDIADRYLALVAMHGTDI